MTNIVNSELFFDWLKFLKSNTEEEFETLATNTKFPEIKRAVERLAQISSDQATQILYDYQLKKIMDERVLQKTARAEGLKEGIKEGEIKGKIAVVINLITKLDKTLTEAMLLSNLDVLYKNQVKEELDRQGIKYQE